MVTTRLAGNSAEKHVEAAVPPVSPAVEAPSDPFEDLASIRLGQDFDDELAIKRLLTRVLVGRPDRQEWIRVRAGPEWRLEVSALEFREDRRLVPGSPRRAGVLLSDLTAVRLHRD